MARAPQTPGGRFSCGSAWAGLLLLAALCVLLAVGAPRARAQMEEHIEHAFGAQAPNLAPVGIAFSVPVAQPEDVVELWTYSMGPDIDYCTAGGYYCPIYGFQDSVEIEYQALGGDLGHLDGYGQFVADVANPTHFRCGPVGPAGVRATPVDAAQVWDPVAHRLLPGWDDDTGTHPSPIGGAGITIREHQHQWMASNDLPPPTVTMQNWVQAGTRVPITVGLGTDWDWCLEDRCPLPDGRIENSLTVTGFSGGTFGYYDANGQWVVSGNRALITHWEAPGVEGNYPVIVTADDTPRGWMTHVYPPRIFSSYDDEPVSTTVDVYVTLEPPHEHQWEAVSNISPPSLSLPSTVRPGERIALSLTGSGSDSDTCLAYDCPFGGTVGNLLQVTSWGGGGSCGYVDAQGQWVPSGDPALITHWRAPGTLGQVTVSAVVDDLPTATSPITGHADSTYNDDPVVIQATTQVAGTPVHSHDWQQVSDIAAPVVTVSGTPALGAVLGLSVSTSADSDRCVAAACTFPGSTAANPVNVT
ncbi:MAG: hypothetical protein K0Q72_3882, partial [Armatimonadetes bacterium]|nr:hypothetical protein [Armatimonadota bacterium]